MFGIDLPDFMNEKVIGSIAAIITGLVGVVKIFGGRKNKNKNEIENPVNPTQPANSNVNTNTINPTFNVYANNLSQQSDQVNAKNIEKIKNLTHILFIDDDNKFKVVNILKKSGWVHTKAIKDVANLDDDAVADAHILFVDVQGVGKMLECKDEGLGLALTLKKKYPEKKIVIYSSENKGDRFHEALRKADNFLSKNAEPYEFLNLVEEYSNEIFENL